MGMIDEIIDKIDFVSGFVPVDMQTADNNGTWVDLSKYEGCIAVLFKGIGTSGDDPIFLVQQAKDNASGSAKALNYSRVRAKIGATSVAAVAAATEYLYAGSGSYTARTDGASPVAVDSSANSFKPTSAADSAFIWVLIRGEHLDVKNGFTHVNVKIADIGSNAQLGCVFYVMVGPRYAEYQNQSAIA